jgi:DNA invertase Pin-like site-specific DNA recombinase
VNAEFKHPLEPPEVRHTAKSISKWTWEKFSRAGFSQSQAARQKKQAEARRISTRGRLINLAKEMQEAGKAVNLNELAEETNIHLATVYRHLAPLASPQNAKTAQGPIYPDMANAKPRNILASERIRAVLEMRAKGMTQQAIASELGIGQARVSKILKAMRSSD